MFRNFTQKGSIAIDDEMILQDNVGLFINDYSVVLQPDTGACRPYNATVNLQQPL
jgi:hypothetical protein